jgi:hypothetical protein
MYPSLLSTYYTPGSAGVARHISEAIIGLLISPSRGLFVFSPVLLFAPYGIGLSLRPGRFEALEGFLLVILIGHLLGVALSNPMWCWGHSFGPRFMTDVTSFLAYFLVPALEDSSNWKGVKAVFLWTALALTLAFSVFVHFTGVVYAHAWAWNTLPTDVDKSLTRLWDWNDSQALRALRMWLAR